MRSRPFRFGLQMPRQLTNPHLQGRRLISSSLSGHRMRRPSCQWRVGVTVLGFVDVPIPNETRYHFVEAVILPRNAEQAELLAGLAATNIEMKLVLVE